MFGRDVLGDATYLYLEHATTMSQWPWAETHPSTITAILQRPVKKGLLRRDRDSECLHEPAAHLQARLRDIEKACGAGCPGVTASARISQSPCVDGLV